MLFTILLRDVWAHAPNRSPVIVVWGALWVTVDPGVHDTHVLETQFKEKISSKMFIHYVCNPYTTILSVSNVTVKADFDMQTFFKLRIAE